MRQSTLQMDCEKLAAVDPFKITNSVPKQADRVHQYSGLLEEYVACVLGDSASEISQSRSVATVSFNGRKREALTLTHPENKEPLVRRLHRLYKIFTRLAEIGNSHPELPQDATLEDTFTSPDSQFSVFTTPDNTYVQFARNKEDARTYALYMRILEIDCNPFISTDPFQLELKEDVKKGFVSDITDILRSQYASLLGEYATEMILAEEPDSERSTMAGSRSASQLIRSPNLWAMSYSDRWIKQLTLEYNEEKIPLIRCLHRLYGIFNKLATGAYTRAAIPEGSMMFDVFTSHCTQMFLFGTETPLAVYIHLTKDAEKFKNFENTESVTYRLLDEANDKRIIQQ